MHNTERVCSNKLGQQFDRVASHIAALILQASGSKFRCSLPPLRELLLQIADSHEYLDRATAAVRVDIKESFFEYVEKGVDLGLIIITAFLLSAEIGNEVSADLDHCTAESICLHLLAEFWENCKLSRTSLSSCLARRVICLMINLGASSDSLIINVDTDLGPLVSLELNSLFPSSLHVKLATIRPVC